MNPIINQRDRQQLDRKVAHLHTLGARAVSEAFAEVAERIGGLPAILNTLTAYEQLTPGQVRAAGGDRFPTRALRQVPR